MKKWKEYFLLFLILWSAFAFSATAAPLQIEVFDVIESKVVKTVPVDEQTKSEAEKLVKSVESLFPKLNPTPRSGIMIKVPFDPELVVEADILKQSVKQVVFILPEGERPYMLIFNEKEQPMFYYFSEDASQFLTMLGLG